MKIRLSLKRISAVLWGFWGLLTGIFLLTPLWEEFSGELVGMGAAARLLR